MQSLRFIQKGYHSVLFKISFVYILTAAIPLIILGVLYGGYLSKKTEKAFEQDVYNQLVLSNNRLDRILSDGRTISETLASTPTFWDLLEKPLSTAEMVIMLQYQVLPILQTANSIHPISNIKVLHESSIVSNVYNRVIYDPQFFQEYTVLKGTLISNELYKINIGYEKNYFPTISSSSELELMIIKPVLQSYGIKRIGFIINSYNLNSIITEIFTQNYPEGTIFALTKESDVIWSSHNLTEPIPASNSYLNIGSANYYVCTIQNSEFNYGLAAYVPIQNNKSTTFIPLAIIILMLVSIISIGILISSYILKRLKQADYALQQLISGNYDFRLDNKGNDEVGIIFRTYNIMAERIQNLLVNIRQAQDAEKIAIYKSLVNQIRPHFLNNALDAIRMKAFVMNLPDISKYLEEIIHYLSYNIGNTNSFVSLEEELRSVIDYISIYNLSKKDNIKIHMIYEQELADSLREYRIPKFTIQPVVENSIRHGFLTDLGKNIFIKIKLELESIIISVEDNGIGISEERLLKVRESLANNLPMENTDRHSSIGLSNIMQRMLIFYGGKVSFEIESQKGVGTVVTITIPKNPPINGYHLGS